MHGVQRHTIVVIHCEEEGTLSAAERLRELSRAAIIACTSLTEAATKVVVCREWASPEVQQHDVPDPGPESVAQYPAAAASHVLASEAHLGISLCRKLGISNVSPGPAAISGQSHSCNM